MCIEINIGSSCSNDSVLTLDRITSGGGKTLIDTNKCDECLIWSWEYGCTGGNGDCEENPEDCSDCDNDGVPECPTYCTTFYSSIVPDVCAPPGHVHYELASDNDYIDDKSVVIEDSGLECNSSDPSFCLGMVRYPHVEHLPDPGECLWGNGEPPEPIDGSDDDSNPGSGDDSEDHQGIDINAVESGKDASDEKNGCGCALGDTPDPAAPLAFGMALIGLLSSLYGVWSRRQ